MSRYPGRILSSTAPTVNANSAKGIWTLDEALRYQRAGTWPVPTGNGDPFFQYNTMLLPGQGTNGAQNNTFLDSSTNNFTITRNGNTTQGTFTPFSGANGNWSNYLGGSQNIYAASNAAFGFGTGDFTVEFWMYLTVAPSSGSKYTLVDFRPTATATPHTIYILNSSGTLYLGFYNGTSDITSSAQPLSTNSWNHCAYSRSGGQLRIYVNGLEAYSAANTIDYQSTRTLTIGSSVAVTEGMQGYLSNFRITKGGGLYTSAFTPPTSPLTTTVSSGTVTLLTCQSNRFVDNSASPISLSVTSTPSVTPFQPFGAPTVAYSASTIGGSGYFDGSGDYVSVGNDALLAPGTGDFTWEGWFYWIGGSGENVVWTLDATGGMNIGLAISSGQWGIGARAVTVQHTFGTLAKNQWMYLAITRSGTTLNAYYNGARVFTGSNSYNFVSGGTLALGSIPTVAGQDFNGYMSGVRWTKGTALYTGSTMTIPTTPNTTTSGGASATTTELLLDFTNAGIIDNAQDNDLETVGGAQISTTQYKWGASSTYFDGTGDYLIGPANSAFRFGTGDFTIECWVYLSSSKNQVILDTRNSAGSTTGVAVAINSSNNPYVYLNNTTILTSSTVLSLSTWTHLAFVKTAGVVSIFVNGNQAGSVASSVSLTDITPTIATAIDYRDTSSTYHFHGYINDLRVTLGFCRYPYNFTAPTAAFPLFWQAAATPSADPYFEYTTLLLPGNGTNGAQNNTFLDSSTNNFSITRNGNTTQGTFTPFSQTGWGNYFSATGDNLRTGVMTPLGSGDFTLECWINPSSFANYRLIWDNRTSDPDANGFAFGLESSGKVYLYTNSGFALTTSGVVVANAWTHIALVRSATGSGNVKIYINGIADSTTATNTANFSRTQAYVGNDLDGTGNPFVGYISNMRATTGALYTSNFTPSTSPLTTTVSAGTCVLLTCQSNRFVDNSASAVSITVAGASVQAFSPFNPTAAYSTSTVGGSGYFDGSGDYLTSASIGTSIGTGDFSLEAWVYTGSAATTFAGLISLNNSAGYPLYLQTSGNAARFLDFQNPGTNFVISGGTVNSNAWVHIVGTRQSGTIRLFVDGKLAAYQAGVTFNYGTAGTSQISGTIAEYISDSRIVIGSVPTAYQTSSTTTGAQIFTPPTAPLTAVTNTQLLLSYTNGGIIDNTAKNNLETVGGASISTSVSKFGGSSMYFDGSGDYLYRPYSPLFALGTGDFTIEWWMNPDSSQNSTSAIFYFFSGVSYFIAHNNLTAYPNVITVYVDNYGGGTRVLTGTTTLSSGTWYHVAITRYSGVWNLYVNGVLQGSTYTNSAEPVPSSAPLYIGSGPSTGFKGYLQDFRVTKGIARYTQNFTPPTTAFLTL